MYKQRIPQVLEWLHEEHKKRTRSNLTWHEGIQRDTSFQETAKVERNGDVERLRRRTGIRTQEYPSSASSFQNSIYNVSITRFRPQMA